MNIRFAVKEDLDNIANLYVCNHKRTYRGLLSDEYLNSLTVDTARNRWEKYLGEEKNKIWIACEADMFLGFAAGTEDAELEKTWYLDSLHVSETARGRGIGTSLIRTMGKYAFENKYNAMSICVVKGNERAENLYLKLGAEYYKGFEDVFANTSSNSEKLLWNDLTVFISER